MQNACDLNLHEVLMMHWDVWNFIYMPIQNVDSHKKTVSVNLIKALVKIVRSAL